MAARIPVMASVAVLAAALAAWAACQWWDVAWYWPRPRPRSEPNTQVFVDRRGVRCASYRPLAAPIPGPRLEDTAAFAAWTYTGYPDRVEWSGLGFEVSRRPFAHLGPIGGEGPFVAAFIGRVISVNIPYWAIAAAAAPLPLWQARRAYRRHRERALAGRCPACGYDLRATPGRCPECGIEVDRTAAKAVSPHNSRSPSSRGACRRGISGRTGPFPPPEVPRRQASSG